MASIIQIEHLLVAVIEIGLCASRSYLYWRHFTASALLLKHDVTFT